MKWTKCFFYDRLCGSQFLMWIFLFFFTLALSCQNQQKMEFSDDKVVAHRGSWKNTGAPQNSFAAFVHALDYQYAGVEFDVHMTSDSLLVVNHDPTYFDLAVQQSTYEQLNANKLENGEPLPFLRDFIIRGMEQRQTRLFVEVKPSVIGKEWALATAAKVVDLIHELSAQPWVIYISFDYDILKEILRIDPAARVMYLNGSKSPEELHLDGMAGAAYHYSVFQRNEEWIEQCHDLGMDVYVWTVNDSELMKRFIDSGVKYIATDEPELLKDFTR